MWLRKAAKPNVVKTSQIVPKLWLYISNPKNCGKAVIRSVKPTILNTQTNGMAKLHLFLSAIAVIIAKMAVEKSHIPTVVKNSVGKPS